MASITLGGNPIHTSGELPKVGSQAPDFKLVKNDLSIATLADFKGSKLVLILELVLHRLENLIKLQVS